MEIMQVMGRWVCTQRVEGLGHMHLRILCNNKGKRLVAVDPVGAREGNWVLPQQGPLQGGDVQTQIFKLI